jgi:DNA polymerase I
MRCYIQPTYFDALGDETDVIAYEDESDLQPIRDQLLVDAGRMTDTLLVNPLEDILSAVNVDIHAAISGQHQSGLGAFL